MKLYKLVVQMGNGVVKECFTGGSLGLSGKLFENLSEVEQRMQELQFSFPSLSYKIAVVKEETLGCYHGL